MTEIFIVKLINKIFKMSALNHSKSKQKFSFPKSPRFQTIGSSNNSNAFSTAAKSIFEGSKAGKKFGTEGRFGPFDELKKFNAFGYDQKTPV